MRIVDIMYTLPFTIFVIILMVLLWTNIILLSPRLARYSGLTMARISAVK